MNVPREEPRKNTSEDTSSGKPDGIPQGIAEVIGAERTGPRKDVNLLTTQQEKLDDLDLDLGLLGGKVDNNTQRNTIWKEKDDTPVLEKSSK